MKREALTPLPRQALYERVIEALTEHVAVNALAVGDRLPSERELAAALRVGRSSVREALATLRSAGMVEARHGDGLFLLRVVADPVRVAPATTASESLPYIWETRQALEAQTARLAASRASTSDIAALESALAMMAEEIADGHPGLEGDRRFHLGVAQAAHNPILLGLYDDISEALYRTSSKSLHQPGQSTRSLAEHRCILAAIFAHEPWDAGNEMLRHLIGTTDHVLGMTAPDEVQRAHD